MRYVLAAVFTTALMLFYGVANAATPMDNEVRHYGTKLNGAAINSNQTITFLDRDIRGMSILVVDINYTRSSATAVTMYCESSSDNGSSWGRVQVCDVADGTCTSTDNLFSNAVSGDEHWPWRVDIAGFIRVRCVIAGTGADASDTVVVKAHAVAE